MRFLYIALAYLLAPIVCMVMLWRGLRDRSYWLNFSQRFGYGSHLRNDFTIWVHAVSVGEVQASLALVGALRERYPGAAFVVTTLTPTGAARARVLFGESVQVRYVPYDLPASVRRFLARVRPRIAIILETELWPNLYHECGRRGIPLVLASARISPRSVGRYRRLAGLFRETLARGIVIGAQSEADAERFRSIGAPAERTHVTGNIKFDFALPPDVVPLGAQLRRLHAAGRPVWIAGSTHPLEEDAVLVAQRSVRARIPNALLVLVPRHTNRFAEVAAWLEKQGVSFTRRSSGVACGAASEVLLVDTLGELIVFYAASDVAFVGGSLVPVGGHNLLEPAALGLPILSGPYTFNAQDIATLLVERGAAQIVPDGAALGARVAALLSDATERARCGALARETVAANRGALGRLLTLIAPLLAQ
ncbi:MAG TPA: lipid IV(A) 3-deoxy-D-manno-octulosonic acid transferase [Steroidobacteraceae bacterium]